ncbi:hypothetical protein [Shewanella gelidii]|uniref:Uncharacterized protein n=1 Tax=Shewanella gelidii TaxID=1642821 RepID=A0A917NC18_9GAMM|nr:hypothetical protein [Shewanella gelidii]MCL1098487.1 hypothetical protein [Shewanella gelidii]GGI82390.1 hypothetical protein GCM10009332_19490 [Shewanella gelidii]
MNKSTPQFPHASPPWLLIVCASLFLSGAKGCKPEKELVDDAIEEATGTVYSVSHTFSVNDVLGGFDGVTYAENPNIICGIGGESPACPEGAAQPKAVKKGGEMMYPVDSEFGFYVQDFVGAAEKIYDQDYGEGWVGNIDDGLLVANAKTVVFKAPKRTGTWCAGLGGGLVKCSSEHYTTLEHVLTCYESVPYTTDDPTTGEQKNLTNPYDNSVIGNCADAKLDNALHIMRAGELTDELLHSTVPGEQMIANESTVRDDIAVGRDYSVTLKDDGKPLYRWGNAVKRPNDVRLYVRMALPDEWKVEGAEFKVLNAALIVHHQITNNPNDQLRPEDMENEAAIGQLPEYLVSGADWVSTKECYEGDGDYIPSGTLFKNSLFAQEGSFSADLQDGLTNAWYTTTDRDPFAGVLDDEDNVLGGPRWRLKSNKFGQDIPSLTIPEQNCLQPPFSHGIDKYPAGDKTTTIINLLDFDEGVESPLASSLGWIDASQNSVNISKGFGEDTSGPNGLSVNGLPLTEDFDLAVYVKGDAKGARLYDVTLHIEYEAVEAEE